MTRRVLLLLLLLVTVFTVGVTAPARAAPAAGDLPSLLCDFFERIETASHDFRHDTFIALVPPAAGFGRLLGLWWILLLVLGVFLSPSETPKILEVFMRRVGWVLAMVDILAAPEWILTNIIDAGEQVFMGIASFVLENVTSAFGSGDATAVPAAGAAGWYTAMWRTVEGTILPLLLKLGEGAMPDGWTDVGALGRIMLLILLAIPYTFVLGIFGAFMVQTLFYVSAVTAVAPLFVIGMPFDALRSYIIASIKFIVGGGLTVVFAAVAMGATASLLQQQFDRIVLASPDDDALRALLDDCETALSAN